MPEGMQLHTEFYTHTCMLQMQTKALLYTSFQEVLWQNSYTWMYMLEHTHALKIIHRTGVCV